MSTIIQVEIGRRTVEVPLCVDEATTKRIAREVGERFDEIERTSRRIDTQLFALQAAFAYAAELHLLREEQEKEQKEIALHLDRIVDRIKDLAAEFS